MQQFRRSTPFQHDQKDQGHGLSTSQTSIAEQDTVRVTALPGSSPSVSSPRLNVQGMIKAGLARLQEPQPEGPFTQGLQIVRPRNIVLGSLPLLTLISAFGLLVISLSYYLARYGNLSLEISFFLGLLLIFAPIVVRLISSTPSRLERIYLICIVGICLYLVILMQSPLHFLDYDEFLHWRTADDIARSGHLFSENSLLQVSTYYPGLEILTNALSTISGLNTFYASLVLRGVVRILMILSLFLFYEQITQSSRMASIASLIYMTNPHFLIFDSIFNYETLALPLATFMLYILVRYETAAREHRWIMIAAYIVLPAVTITHHMTDYFFDGLLILWAVVSLLRNSSRNIRINLTTISLFGVLLAFAYAFLLKGNPVLGYLSEYFDTAFTQLAHVIAGTSTTRHLFASQGAAQLQSPVWDQLLMIASVGIVSFGLPFGLLSLWHHHRHHALAVAFGIASLAYPISQAFRFTNFGSEITDRAAAFLFLPIAYVLTIFITHFWPTRKLSWKATLLITCALSAVLMGGVLIESGPVFSSMPGPYMVVADVRSIEPEGIQSALWTRSYLGPDNQIGTDRINQLLMLSYGDQRIVTSGDGVAISTVFLSPQLGPQDVTTLRQAGIRYLVVDQRLSTSLPLVGFYFEPSESDAFMLTGPIPRQALTKFSTFPQINRIYDSGDIVIYDIGPLLKGASS